MQKKKIFIAPSDWGMGHVTRIIPLIRCLLKLGADVSIGGTAKTNNFLKQYFPQLQAFLLPSYKVKYSATGVNYFHLLLQFPGIFQAIKEENKIVRSISGNFDAVISDNRFGCYSKEIFSVYITHQLNILYNGKVNSPATYIHKTAINKFNECWVPDYEDETTSLAGIMSHKQKKQVSYLGPLSRFFEINPLPESSDYEAVAIVSGPEPQRKLLQENLISLFKLKKVKSIIAGADRDDFSQDNVHLSSHITDEKLAKILINAKWVFCRSGYSTLCDLYALGISAVLIPTPNQPEQEYLAKLHSKKNECHYVKQDEISEKLFQYEKKTKENRSQKPVILEKIVFEFLRKI